LSAFQCRSAAHVGFPGPHRVGLSRRSGLARLMRSDLSKHRDFDANDSNSNWAARLACSRSSLACPSVRPVRPVRRSFSLAATSERRSTCADRKRLTGPTEGAGRYARGLGSGGCSLGESAVSKSHSPGWMTGRPKRTRPCFNRLGQPVSKSFFPFIKHIACQVRNRTGMQLNCWCSLILFDSTQMMDRWSGCRTRMHQLSCSEERIRPTG